MAKQNGFKFKKSEDVVKIQFAEDHDLYGLEVHVEKRVPIGVILGATEGNLAQAIKPLIKRITWWNLEDDDGPIPVSREAFDEQFDVQSATALVGAWATAVMEISGPLDEPSSDGSS